MGRHRKHGQCGGSHMTRHHRRCRSNGGGNESENISWVSDNCHKAWHINFSNFQPHTIAHIINDKWIPRDKKFICVEAQYYDEIIRTLRERRLLS